MGSNNYGSSLPHGWNWEGSHYPAGRGCGRSLATGPSSPLKSLESANHWKPHTAGPSLWGAALRAARALPGMGAETLGCLRLLAESRLFRGLFGPFARLRPQPRPAGCWLPNQV
eukprot:5055996-Alexandrium_andersonii.AAC.1